LQQDQIDLEKLERALSILGGPNNTSQSHIQVNAGGIALWISVTCCVATMLGLIMAVVMGTMAASDINRQLQERRQKDDTQDAYINVMYQNRTTEEKK
jgi:hypothetical protein